MAKEPARNRKLPHILVVGDVAYFKSRDGDHICFVLGRMPTGFLEFNLSEAVKWEPSDEDGRALREYIVEHFTHF
jgi:hypothetical protein